MRMLQTLTLVGVALPDCDSGGDPTTRHACRGLVPFPPGLPNTAINQGLHQPNELPKALPLSRRR
eukprot:scaffold888_cov569-Prasinococcus_capsulatus_cf.AAC.8